VQHVHLLERQAQTRRLAPSLLELPPEQVLVHAHILLELLVVSAGVPAAVEEGPQDKLLDIIALDLLGRRAEEPLLEVCVCICDVRVALLEKGAALGAGEGVGVVGGALEVGAVGEEDEEVEEGLGEGDDFDGERDRISCGFEAVEVHEEERVEDAERGEVVEGDDAGADEDVLEAGVVDHLRCSTVDLGSRVRGFDGSTVSYVWY